MENKNQIICEDCGIEYDKNEYYLSRIKGQERMPVCKYCFENDLKNSGDMTITFKKYNVPYVSKLWSETSEFYGGSDMLSRYMKALELPQYINLQWKDTDWYKAEIKETNFYDKIVTNLKKEA